MLTDGWTDEWMDRWIGDARKVITIAHPEHNSGELKKVSSICSLLNFLRQINSHLLFVITWLNRDGTFNLNYPKYWNILIPYHDCRNFLTKSIWLPDDG